MSANVGYATLQIIPSAKGMLGNIKKELGDELDDAGDKAGTSSAKKFGGAFGSSMKTVAKAGALAFAAGIGAAAVFGKASIDAASNLDESMSKVNVVFGTAADSIVDWSKTAATALGSSQQQALEAAGTYGNLLKAFGLNDEAAKGMSISMVELATDLASFNNTSVPEALQALQSGISGETEPLKKYGVAINDVRLKEEALALGLISSTKDALTPAAKAQASYSLIMKDTALAQGDFARTSEGLANKQKIMGAQFEDVKAKIGQALLPAMSAVVGFISGSVIPGIQNLAETWMPRLTAAFGVVKDWVSANWPAIRDVIVSAAEAVRSVVVGAFDAISAAIGWLAQNEPALGAIAAVIGGVLVAAVVSWSVATWAQVSALWAQAAAFAAANAPIILITAAIAALVAGVIWAYQNWDWFRNAVDRVASFARDTLWPILQNVGSFLAAAFTMSVSVATSAWNGMSTAITAVWGFLKEVWDRSELVRAFLAGAFSIAVSAVKMAWDGLTAGIGLAVTAVQVVWDKTEGLRGFLVGAFSTGMSAAKMIWDGFVSVIRTVSSAIQTVIDKASTAISTLRTLTEGRTVSLIGAIDTSTLPKDHAGGLIPGYAGQESLHVLMAGETVLTKQQASGRFMNFDSAASGSRYSGPLFGDVHVHDELDADGLFRRANFALAGV